MDDEESKKLQRLLHSSNPEDIQAANQIIKAMVKKDEEKMEKVTKRVTLLDSVNTNIKLLSDMLDNFNVNSSNNDERELIAELGDACEKVRPNLYRVASEMEEGDDAIGEILMVSDELTKVIDRFRCVIVLNKQDPHPKPKTPIKHHVASNDSNLDTLLNLDADVSPTKSLPESQLSDDPLSELETGLSNDYLPPDLCGGDLLGPSEEDGHDEAKVNKGVADNLNLLADLDLKPSEPKVETSQSSLLDLGAISLSSSASVTATTSLQPSSSKLDCLDSLDLLGESVMKENLPTNIRTSFDQKRQEKLPMHTLMQQKSQELTGIRDLTSQLPPTEKITANDSLEKEEPSQINELATTSQTKTETKEVIIEPKSSPRTCDINLNEIQISISEIKPNPAQQPLVMQSPDTGQFCH